jgi:glycosyltransferase involved in cell wall biosynthesis
LADVVVIPSLSDIVEAYSIVASEAWARKKPVVAYSVGALKYRVKNGINGYLARPMDQKELAEKIAMALSKSLKFRLPSDVWSWNEVAGQFRQKYIYHLRSRRGISDRDA